MCLAWGWKGQLQRGHQYGQVLPSADRKKSRPLFLPHHCLTLENMHHGSHPAGRYVCL